MSDPTENIRRLLIEEQQQAIQQLGSDEAVEAQLRKEHGQIWNTEELKRDFTVTGFLAPFVLVQRKSDGKSGTLMFTHMPRFYYGFQGT